MRSKRKGMFQAVIAIAVLLALVLPWVAEADNVYNDLDGSIDSTFEMMNLVEGGSNGTTTLFVETAIGDGKNGCNLTGHTTLVVSVNTSNASIASVSPTSITFESCGDNKTLTVTPHNPGSADITLGLVSNGTAGSFDLAPASFTVNVAAAPPTDTTQPSIVPTIIGTLGDDGWYTSDVTVSWTVTDPDSSISSSSGCDSTTITTDTSGITLTCTATSAGGMNSKSVTIKRDATVPTVTCTVPDQIIWYGADVTVNCTAADGGSDLADPAADASFSLSTSVPGATETDNASTNSRLVSDNAGNAATAGPYIFKVDLKGPVVTCDPADGDWHASDVSIACSASDGGSGLADSVDANFSLTTSVPANTETNNASTNSRVIFDTVGNSATAGPISGNMIDKKAPVVNCDAADGDWHASNVSIACTATDGGSDLADAADASFSLMTTVAPGDEESNALTGSRVVSDNVGNSAIAGPIGGNMVDLKAPTVTCGSADGTWHGSDVSISCTASDGGSGLANPADAGFSLTTDVATGVETSNASTNSYVVADGVGNTTPAGPISGNKVDKKAPTITINVPTGTTYLLGQGVAADYSCTDGGSGTASCDGPVLSGSNINTASVGPQSFGVTATDNVGNQSSSSVSYSVAYASGGMCLDNAGHQILQPINADGSSVFKQGSTVPAKFRVCDANGNSIGTPGVVVDFKLIKKTNGTSADTNEVVVSTNADSAFRWDPGAQQWIFNISTKNLTKGYTYTYQITLNDGSNIQFTFGLK